MKKYLIIILFNCISKFGYAQVSSEEHADSLKQLINNAQKDTVQVHLLNDLLGLYVYNRPESALKYTHKMLQLSIELNYEHGIADAYLNMSTAHSVLGNYAGALHNAFEGLKLYRLIDDPYEVAATQGYIGEIYEMLGDYKQALSYYYRYRKVFEATNDSFYYKGFSKRTMMMNSDVSLAGAYLLGNLLDSALFFAKRGFDMDRSLDLYWIYPSLTLGDVYFKLDELDSAMKYYRSDVEISSQNDRIDVNIGIATIFQKRNQLDSCIFFAKSALDSAQLIKYSKGVLYSSELLSWAYDKINPVTAIFYYKINKDVKDSLNNREKINQINFFAFNEEIRQRELAEKQAKYQTKIRIFGLLAILAISLLVAIFLFRNNRNKQRDYKRLQFQKQETDLQKDKVEKALLDLKTTQAQLIQSEKMASLGELAAGIAHEIQNPLNFVNNFAEVNSELIAEMKQAIEKGNTDEVSAIARNVDENEQKIILHGKRAASIIKGMLQHSRTSTGDPELIDINALAGEYLKLSYHGLRAKDKSFIASLKTDFDESIGKIKVIPQDFGRVLLNLYNNAFYVVSEKKGHQPEDYEPTVSVSTKKMGDRVEIRVKDNGDGVPQKVKDKIFQPFFTTKPTGQGTGLGLSLSYDIVKTLGGELLVESIEGEGATFIVKLPMK